MALHPRRYNRSDFILTIQEYPFLNLTNGLERPENFQNDSTFSLATGTCFTYQNRNPRALSQENMEMILLPMREGTPMGEDRTVLIFFHNASMWLPSLGISSELMGQQFFYSKLILSTLSWPNTFLFI